MSLQHVSDDVGFDDAAVIDHVDCNVYDEQFFNREFCNKKQFIVFHHNIRSFNHNYDELSSLLNRLTPSIDALILSETWFSASLICESIPGFNAFHSARSDRRGGGVSIFVRDHHIVKPISELTIVTDKYEVCSVNIQLARNSFSIIAIYRPPNKSDVPVFNTYMNETVFPFLNAYKDVFLVGDFNIDLLNPIASEKDFIDLCRSYTYVPLITKPTHVTHTSESIIDHFWTNNLTDLKSGVINCDITDHFPIFCVVPVKENYQQPVKKVFRDHSTACLSRLKANVVNSLDNFDICNNSDVHNLTSIFHDKVYDAYNESCPVRQKSISPSSYSKPWITKPMKALINHKHRLFWDYKHGLLDFSAYNKVKNMCTSELRLAKSTYFKNKFNRCDGDVKGTWKNVNYLIKPIKNSRPDIILTNNGLDCSDPAHVTNLFNDYFSDVGKNLNELIPRIDKEPTHFMGPPSLSSFVATPATVSEVLKLISSLKLKGCHINTLPVFVYKYLAEEISPIIVKLFNLSVAKGVFPDCLKVGRVIPVHKSGDKKNTGNYRPISTLPILSKIFERLMSCRLYEYLNKNNLLCKHQFGFRTKSSTSDALIEFLDHAYASLDCGDIMLAVFLDFSKAFDTVNHAILIDKLEHVGVRGSNNDWFNSYLCNRKQFVEVGAAKSNLRNITVGVPQGSVLGPLLFLLYINDMSNSSPEAQLVHFADDTTMFRSGNNFDTLVASINSQLVSVDEWLCVNRLSLNVSKTTYMVISNRDIPPLIDIRIRGIQLVRSHCAKFLGVFIDDKLRFEDHIRSVHMKISRAVGIIRRILSLVPPDIILKLYYSLIYPHLTYGVAAWGKSGVTLLERIVGLQRRALKLLPFNFLSKPSCKNIMSFYQIYSFYVLQIMFKIINSQYHQHLSTRVINSQTNHYYPTRFKVGGMLNPPVIKKTKSESSFLYQSISLWNTLPQDVRDSYSLSIFKCKLRSFLTSV